MVFVIFVFLKFTFFVIALESNSNFVCTPANLYFSESSNPELSKKYKLRLAKLNSHRASSARAEGTRQILAQNVIKATHQNFRFRVSRHSIMASVHRMHS